MNMLRGFMDNDSAFGQMMLRAWAFIICNLCFLVTALPVVTAGAGWAAMDYALMKTMKNRETAAPFRDFWHGFRVNFKQATLSWLAGALLLGFLGLEWYWCRQFGGAFRAFQIGILVIGVLVLIVLIYIFPTMAAFEATLPQLVKNCIYFAFTRPHYLLVILFVHIVPLAMTYLFLQLLPLFFGFAAVSGVTVSLLLREFRPYLKKDAAVEAQEEENSQKPEEEILKEMEKLGM